eukprot:4331806-Alexandrium_andersonii.AAC.1
MPRRNTGVYFPVVIHVCCTSPCLGGILVLRGTLSWLRSQRATQGEGDPVFALRLRCSSA